MNRLSWACVLLAAAVAGLFFSPVFGLGPLLLPIGVTVLLAYGVTELCAHKESLVPWRPLLVVVAGLLGITETVLFPTTVGGLPTGETFAALASGVTDSWQSTLQSTWPARPEPALLLFVPLLVLVASALGIELLQRLRKPLPALAPSFAVVILSQLYSSLSDTTAVGSAFAYAVVAGTLLAVTRPASDHDRPDGAAARKLAFAMAVPAAVLGLAAAIAAGLLVSGTAYSLKDDQAAPLNSARVTSPLNEIAYRLEHPGTEVFSFRSATKVDRWPLVVLDSFDGVNWTPGGSYRRLGTELAPGPSVTVPSRQRTATVSAQDVGGPWLPSQTWPAGVTGLDPLVEEAQGTLVLQNRPRADADYTLTWWEPQVDPKALRDATVDSYAPGGLGSVGEVPPGVGELARKSVNGLRASFQTALLLEQFFNDNYRLTTGSGLPSGHSWPQLSKFLLETHQGTSEQFAAAYVAMARIVGIPARLAVGYRAPTAPGPDGSYSVRNGDVLAWPEVAVAGVGWVPMDPSGEASAGGAAGAGGLAAATAQARAQLPPAGQLKDAPVSKPGPGGAKGGDDGDDGPFPWETVAIVVTALVLLWFCGIPLLKLARSRRRRRRPGLGAVLGAWHEARDRLREHHVPVTIGMTVRDLAVAAGDLGGKSTTDGLRTLGSTVDAALWSGKDPSAYAAADAWAAVRTVRRGLAHRGLRARLRAAVNPRPLLPPRS
jgi:transglutaminase-like putative cysteine protease